MAKGLDDRSAPGFVRNGTRRRNRPLSFEQAFSADEGRTWEVNWVAVDTRTAPP
jgi:hypothetical protein